MIELGANDINEQQATRLARAINNSLVDGDNVLHAVAHHAVTDAHHHQGKTTVRHKTGRETAGKETTHHIEQDGMRRHDKSQHEENEENALKKSQTHSDALTILGSFVMQNAAMVHDSIDKREK